MWVHLLEDVIIPFGKRGDPLDLLWEKYFQNHGSTEANTPQPNPNPKPSTDSDASDFGWNYWLDLEDPPPPRVGLASSKVFGKAHEH
jgi:hypothetical protein